MLSIFCPYRGRESFFHDFIYSYSKLYPDACIYMAEQIDDDPFKRGQLANVLFNQVLKDGGRLETILFADVDLRLFERIEFEEMMDRNKTITVPFDKIELYDLIRTGLYKPCGKPSYFLSGNKLTGGLSVYSKEMFEKCCGFSNVYVGWGCEDSDFLLRFDRVAHEHNTIFHLEHPRERKNHSYINRNVAILDKKRTDPKFDGFGETIVRDIQRIELSPKIVHYKVSGIGTPEDFKYKQLLAI